MSFFRRNKAKPASVSPAFQKSLERSLADLAAANADPYAAFPNVSSDASEIVHQAIDQVGEEYGVQYRLVTLKAFDHSTLLGFRKQLGELATVVDFLLEAPEDPSFDSEADRNMYVYGVVPAWEMILSSNPSTVMSANLDMVFRVAAVSLHNADANDERRAASVWFDSASIELEKLRRMTELNS